MMPEPTASPPPRRRRYRPPVGVPVPRQSRVASVFASLVLHALILFLVLGPILVHDALVAAAGAGGRGPPGGGGGGGGAVVRGRGAAPAAGPARAAERGASIRQRSRTSPFFPSRSPRRSSRTS